MRNCLPRELRFSDGRKRGGSVKFRCEVGLAILAVPVVVVAAGVEWRNA